MGKSKHNARNLRSASAASTALKAPQLCEYPPGTPKNDPSAGCAYPRDLRDGILQASDHRHPPGASPTHVPPALASSPARAPTKLESISAQPFSRGVHYPSRCGEGQTSKESKKLTQCEFRQDILSCKASSQALSQVRTRLL